MMSSNLRQGDRRIGGQKRAERARNFMSGALLDDNNPKHFLKDIEIARMFNVTRLTIYRIREELGIPSRLERIHRKLKKLDTGKYTLSELASLLNLKYQNVYKVIVEQELPYKSGREPKSP